MRRRFVFFLGLLVTVVLLSGQSPRGFGQTARQNKVREQASKQTPSSEAPKPAEKLTTQSSSQAAPALAGEGKSRLEKISNNASAVRSIVVDLLLVSLLIAFAVAAVWEMRRKLVIIELMDVPEDLSKKGYTPSVVAQRIVAEITTLRRAARFRGRLEEGIELSATQLDFTVPTAGISYRNTIRYARQLFRRPEDRISGEIVRDRQTIRIVLRTRAGRVTSSGLNTLNEKDIPELLHRAALEIATLVDPYLVASYWFWTEQPERKFERTFETVRNCIANTPVPRHHDAYVIWGNALFFQKNFAEAEQKYRFAAKLSPKSAAIYNSWGNLLRAQRRFDEAASMYKKATQLERKHISAWNNLANVCNDRRRYREAIRYTGKALRINSGYAPAWNNRGYALLQLGNYTKAESEFRRAIELDPNYGWSYINWARLLLAQKRHEEAFAKLATATAIAETLALVYGLWGDGLAQLGKYHEATEMYERASANDPNAANGMAGLASLSLRQRRYGETIQKCQKVFEMDRYYIYCWFAWAESLRFMRQYSAAMEKYQAILELDRYQARAQVGIGWVHTAHHQLRDAESSFKQATRIDPTESWSWRSWGDLLFNKHHYNKASEKYLKASEVDRFDSNAYIGLGNIEMAIECFRKACELDPRNARAHGRLADALITAGRVNEALKQLQESASHWREETAFFAEWGDALSRLDLPKEAETAYRQSLALDPSNSNVLRSLALALRTLGQEKESLRLLRKALTAEPWNDRARGSLGLVLNDLGRSRLALRWYSHCAHLAPESATILLAWADVIRTQALRASIEEERTKSRERSLEILRRAATIDPWDTAPLRATGHLLLELKRFREARATFMRAVRLDPCDSLAWEGNADAFRQLGDHRKAIKAYNRALVYAPRNLHALTRLAESLQHLKRHEEAVVQINRALAINPTNPRLLKMLEASQTGARPVG